MPRQMQVTVSKFRKCETGSWDFQANSSTLIMGRSGSGKTTILRAVAWCLYGKGRKVAPKDEPRAKTSVTVSLPSESLTVTRRRSPGLLTVVVGETRLVDCQAQEFIVRRYGTYEVWAATSYAAQRQLSSFLQASTTEKLSVLNLITFTSNEAREHISHLSSSVKLLEERHTRLSSELSPALSEYLTLSSSVEVDYVVEEVDEERRHSVTFELARVRKEESDALSLPPKPSTSVPETAAELERALSHRLRRAAQGNYSQADLDRARLLEAERERQLERARVLHVRYSQQALEEELADIDYKLSSQEAVRTAKELAKLEEKIRRCSPQPVPVPQPKVSREDLTRLQHSLLERLVCPCCQEPLYYRDGELSPHPGTQDRREVERLARQVSEWESYVTARERYQRDLPLYQSLVERRDSLPRTPAPDVPLLSEREVAALIKRQAQLEEVRVVEVPVPSSEIERSLVPESELLLHYSEKVLRESVKERVSYERLLVEYERKRRALSLPDITPDYLKSLSQRREELAQLQELLCRQHRNTLLSRQCETLYAELVGKRDVLEQLTETLNDYYSLLSLASETERRLLKRTVSSINKELASICSSVFPCDVTVRLTLQEESAKRECLLSVTLDGLEYDDLNDLSPGEQDRVTLAMTVALSSLWHCPLLLVDEPFAQLDEELQELAVRAMREHAPSKTLLCVSHNIVTGLFDHVVSL